MIERPVNVGDASAGPADRPARFLERGERLQSRAGAARRGAGAAGRAAQQLPAAEGAARAAASSRGRRSTRSRPTCAAPSRRSKSAQSQVELAQNRLSYTRLVVDAGGSVATVGAEPGEVVPAGRMVVQIARAGGRDARLQRAGADARTPRPRNPEITVALTTDPKVSAKGRVREVSPARRSGHRHVPGARRTHRSARRLRLGSTVTGQHAHRDRLRASRSRGRRWSARARSRRCGSWIPRPRRCRCGRSRSRGHDADRRRRRRRSRVRATSS